MMQDLNDLSLLGKSNTTAIAAINFDLEKLDLAACASDKLARLLALANGDKALQSETKSIRDKVYTQIKELDDEIRNAGKYLFWENEKRYKVYISQYWTAQSNEKKPETTTD